MYKNVSKNLQNIANSLNIRTLQNGTEIISEEERHNNLKQATRVINRKLQALPKKHPERRVLGLEMQRLQDELKILNRASKPRPNLASYFMVVARERLTLAEWRLWREEARKRHDLDERIDKPEANQPPTV